jgi:hypothetical protein
MRYDCDKFQHDGGCSCPPLPDRAVAASTPPPPTAQPLKLQPEGWADMDLGTRTVEVVWAGCELQEAGLIPQTGVFGTCYDAIPGETEFNDRAGWEILWFAEQNPGIIPAIETISVDSKVDSVSIRLRFLDDPWEEIESRGFHMPSPSWTASVGAEAAEKVVSSLIGSRWDGLVSAEVV